MNTAAWSQIVSILLICQILLVVARRGDEKYVRRSIGPVALCDGKADSLTSFIETCHSRCMTEPEPRRTIQLTIWQNSVNGPPVVECRKLSRKQKFTRTWTFSDIEGELISEYISVTDAECREAIATNCPTMDCNHRESTTLTPEFHYGSDTLVTENVITLLSMPSVLVYDTNDLYISPVSSQKKYLHDAKMGEDDRKMYYWGEFRKPESCPLNVVNQYGCDVYNDDGDYYLCSGGRFIVTPIAGKYVAKDLCSAVHVSKEGFLFTTDKGDSAIVKTGRLGIDKEHELAADGDYLRHKIHIIATHLDAEICSNQCEMIMMESRLKLKEESLVRVGNEYLQVFKNGTGAKCSVLHSCRLPEKHVFCGSPPRIGVLCAGISGFWNPLEAYLTSNSDCLKPLEIENLTVSLGSEHYVVDNEMTILAPPNATHGVYPTSFESMHMRGIQLEIEDLQDLKKPWSKASATNADTSRSKSTDTNIISPQLTIGKSVIEWAQSARGWLISAEHIVGITVVLIAASMTVLLSLKIIRLFRRDKMTTYHPVAHRDTVGADIDMSHLDQKPTTWI